MMDQQTNSITRGRRTGFTLVEMMIVVAIVGILSMFALPAYTDYKRRTYVVEALNMIVPLQMAVAEYYKDNRTWPISTTDLPEVKNYDKTGPIATVMFWGHKYNGSHISILFSNKMGKNNYYHRVDLEAKTNGLGAVTWVCSGGTYMPLPSKYLPPNCR